MQEYRVLVNYNGTERWYNKDNQRHRHNGPAIVYADGTQFWYKNGRFHRDDGPAIIYADGYKEYWIDGIYQPNSKEFKELTVADIEKILGYRIKVVK
jgi:uncharacterized membrane protein